MQDVPREGDQIGRRGFELGDSGDGVGRRHGYGYGRKLWEWLKMSWSAVRYVCCRSKKSLDGRRAM